MGSMVYWGNAGFISSTVLRFMGKGSDKTTQKARSSDKDKYPAQA